jgi:hypothetical protein
MSNQSLQDWFDNEYWPQVIRKDSKKDAFKAMTKLNPNLDLRQEIIKGQIRYNLYVEKNKIEKIFIKFPATWIRGECWKDEDKGETPKNKIIVYCDCGKIAKLGKLCLECLTKQNETYTPGLGTGIPEKQHYDHLKTIGLAKRKEETVSEWINRMQVYCRQNIKRGMG